jgi:hypothetical protein
MSPQPWGVHTQLSGPHILAYEGALDGDPSRAIDVHFVYIALLSDIKIHLVTIGGALPMP